ncbi:MAG: gephyrin-like molybdotransferase Glp [Acidobacteriota bacterium]
MAEFLRVITSDQFVQKLDVFPRLAAETVSIDDSLDRTVACDIASPEDLPEAPRSTMDGFAVRAADTFGASSSIPALLTISGDVRMGLIPAFGVRSGEAARIPTGGFVPKGADAVVMVEHTDCRDEFVEIFRPVTVGENVLEKSEDVSRGETLFQCGRQVRSCDVGLLAALGITELQVFRRPKVAVVSTGDEVVPIDRRPQPGQIRDANMHSVAALVRACGGEPIAHGIVTDEEAVLRETLLVGLSGADVLAISGGSSVGERDLMLKVVSELPGAEVLAHGVAIRPGKPTLLARIGDRAVFGLPGHPVSAWVVAAVFLAPFLRYLQGEPLRRGPLGRRVAATLSASVHSVPGLEVYMRVRLETGSGGLVAVPLFGKSSMLSTLARADALLRVPLHSEGLAKGETVEVVLL